MTEKAVRVKLVFEQAEVIERVAKTLESIETLLEENKELLLKAVNCGFSTESQPKLSL